MEAIGNLKTFDQKRYYPLFDVPVSDTALSKYDEISFRQASALNELFYYYLESEIAGILDTKDCKTMIVHLLDIVFDEFSGHLPEGEYTVDLRAGQNTETYEMNLSITFIRR